MKQKKQQKKHTYVITLEFKRKIQQMTLMTNKLHIEQDDTSQYEEIRFKLQRKTHKRYSLLISLQNSTPSELKQSNILINR